MTELQIEKIYEIKNRAENFLSELLENERQADVYGETENDDKVFQSIEFLEFAIKEARSKHMKQIDRIRNMNAEELAEMLNKTILGIDCFGCVAERRCAEPCVYSISTNMSCKDIIKAWLESEVNND